MTRLGKWIVVGIAFVAAAVLLTDARISAKMSRIRAREISIVDADGNSWITLSADQESGRISIANPSNTAKWSVLVERNPLAQGGQVQLAIKNRRGHMRLTSGEYANAGPLLYLSNSKGKLALCLGLWGDNGEGYLRIDDNTPQAGVSAEKHAGEKLADRAVMVVGPDGQLVWAAPHADQGE